MPFPFFLPINSGIVLTNRHFVIISEISCSRIYGMSHFALWMELRSSDKLGNQERAFGIENLPPCSAPIFMNKITKAVKKPSLQVLSGIFNKTYVLS